MTGYAHPGLAEPRTKEEWRAYLAARPPQRPAMPPLDRYVALGEVERERLNDQRDRYHSALALVRTGQMTALHRVMERRVRLNAHQAAGARRGIVLDGPPTVGKSTLVKLFAADFERRLRRREPEKFADGYQKDGWLIDYTPVVYLTIPSQATPKDLSMALAGYMAMPLSAHRQTKTDITARVLEVMQRCGVQLVVIDDVHFMDLSLKEGKVVNDHLKYLANHTAATFIYTGVELKKSGLFLEGSGGTRATQTSGRNSLHQLRPLGFRTAEQQREWAEVVLAFEQTLVLYRHRPGHLVKLAPYLFERTSGSICGLSDLIRESAIEAVMSGEEAVTRKLMDSIEISDLAQSAYRERRKTAKSPAVPGATAV